MEIRNWPPRSAVEPLEHNIVTKRLMILGVALVGCIAADPFELTPHPTDGSSHIYYDIDCDGQILRIDYKEGRAQVIAQIPLVSLDASATLTGWLFPDEGVAYVFSELYKEATHGRHDRLYVFDFGLNELRMTPILANLVGDCTNIPASPHAFLCSTHLSDDKYQNVLLRLGDEPTLVTLNTNLLHCDWSVSEDRKFVYTALGYGNPVLSQVNLKSGSIEYGVSCRDVLRDSVEGSTMHVVSMMGSYALVNREVNETCELLLVALADKRELARVPLPMSRSRGGRWSILSIENQAIRVARFPPATHPNYFTQEALASLYVLDAEDSSISLLEECAYNQKEQIALVIGDGTIQISPRYRFDYVSMTDLKYWQITFPFANHAQRDDAIEALKRTLRGDQVQDIVYPALHNQMPVQHLEIESNGG